MLVHYAYAGRTRAQWIALLLPLPAEQQVPTVGGDHAGKNFYERRLARTVFAHQCENFAAFYGQVDVVQCDDAGIRFAYARKLCERHIIWDGNECLNWGRPLAMFDCGE